MKFDLILWFGASALLSILKMTAVIDWTWPLVAVPAAIPIVVWCGIIIAAVIAWPFRWWAGARNSSSGRD